VGSRGKAPNQVVRGKATEADDILLIRAYTFAFISNFKLKYAACCNIVALLMHESYFCAQISTLGGMRPAASWLSTRRMRNHNKFFIKVVS